MKTCKNCNTEMMENERMFMVSDTEYHPVMPRTPLLKIDASVSEGDIFVRIHTAVCPVCGLVENYIDRDGLDEIKEVLSHQG